MNRFLLFCGLVLMTVSAAIATPTSVVMLHHQGTITMFEPDSLSVAISRAETGDTILLSSGQFPKVTLDKTITLRGEGNTTFVNGIDVNGNSDDPISPTIESLRVVYVDNYGNNTQKVIALAETTDGLTIKQCEMSGITFKGSHSNLMVDRCHVKDYSSNKQNIDASLKSATFKNVYFQRGISFNTQATENITFVNCDVLDVSNSTYFRGTMLNSYLYAYYYYTSGYSQAFRNCAMINCLLNYVDISPNDSTVENCYYWNDTKLGCPTKDFLLEKGYLGNDGTVVGIDGGVSPINYSYNSGIPRVSSSKITLDNVNKVLNVDVTFESN